MIALTASPPFEFVLHPNHALSTAGSIAVMAGVGLVGGAVGIAFLLWGAWPVTGFLGSAMLGLFAAFRWIGRQSRRRETIRLEPGALTVRRVDPRGQADEIRFEPYWARVRLEQGGRAHRLLIGSHGRSIEIGRFLTADDKATLARALDEALSRVR